MAPLKGNTLGEKHRNYNTQFKEILDKGSIDLTKISYDEDDIDNMMKIDMACQERNVDYIMEVLKCDDMLYVTRAIKHSLWLITDPEYAHLINPEHLNVNVFPEMTAKSITKFMQHIRRHLKNEKRAEDFFTYVDKTNPKMALKWLENCSLKFVETIVASHANSISPEILKRICKKSVGILQIYVNNVDTSERYISFENVMYLLKSHTVEFLNITESLPSWRFSKPSFNEKHTQIIAKRCLQRLVDNFRDYKNRIDLPTFVRHIKISKIDLESLLLSIYERCWLNFDNLKPFLVELPQERNEKLLRNLYGLDNDLKMKNFDTKSTDNISNNSEEEDVESTSDSSSANTADDTSDGSYVEYTEIEILFRIIEPNSTFSDMYRWYEFLPFETAFEEIKKIIYAESSAEERHAMLIVLLATARNNMELIRTVLQYYHDKHINEPYIHKIQFVNRVLEQHDAFRFDDTTWNVLNNIFHSLEVYVQSTNKVQQCLATIILHNLLHGLPIHKNVEQKFTFNTMKDIKKKLNHKEQEKLFDYLYNQLVVKLNNQDLNRESGMKQAVTLIENIWTLIKDWKKEATHHQFVIDNIIKLNNLNKQLSWDIDMRHLYCLLKPFHRQLFQNSLILYPCQEMCINALKHDPGLLVRHESAVTALCCNDKMSLRNLLSKLRIYWPESLVNEWRNTLMNDLQKCVGHRAMVRNIFFLSSQKLLLDFIKKYTPSDNKIPWSEAIETDLSLRKHIAKSMHLARPNLSVEVLLSYAKGDYLQYAHLSLNAIYYNLRSKDIDNHIKILLSSPVSVQKHGIRLACKRMNIEELLTIFSSIWKSTRNSSIRCYIFKSVYKFLQNNANETLVTDIWEVLSFMIDDLSHEENKSIYTTLGNVREVPVSVIGEYYKKSYLFLRDLPERIGLEHLFSDVFDYATTIIQYLDHDFVENTILIPVYEIFVQKKYQQKDILSAYLLCSKDEATQMQKFKNLFEPLFMLCIPKWKNNEIDTAIIDGFKDILTNIANDLPRFVFEMNMIMPVKILTEIQNRLELELCEEEMYVLLTHCKLYVAYIKLLNDMMIKRIHSWERIREKSIGKYYKICLRYLKEDIESNFPSIYILFAVAMQQTCSDFSIEFMNLLNLLDAMLICKDENVYMLVLKMLPDVSGCEVTRKLIKIREKLYCYPSDELKMHYYSRYTKKH